MVQHGGGTGIRWGSAAASFLAFVGVVWHIILWVMFESPENLSTEWVSRPGDSGKFEFVCEKGATGSPLACSDGWAPTAAGSPSKCLGHFAQQKVRRAAGAHCAERGGQLVTIHSEAENRAVARLCRLQGSCWIGLKASSAAAARRLQTAERIGRVGTGIVDAVAGGAPPAGVGGAWLWVDGSNLTYDAWHPDHPKSSKGEDSATVGRRRDAEIVAALTFGIPLLNVLVVSAVVVPLVLCSRSPDGVVCVAGAARCSGCCACAFALEAAFCVFFVAARSLTPLLLVEAAWAVLSAAVLVFVCINGKRLPNETVVVVEVPPPARIG